VEKKRAWIERTSRRLQERQEVRPPEPTDDLPGKIELKAIGEDWSVQYQVTDARSVRLIEQTGRQLLVSGVVSHHGACRTVLKRWLCLKARSRLIPWFRELATARGFFVNRVFVRNQRTRWGSCSRQANISLNARLLLLPPDIVRYVFLHELVHIGCPNHSAEFWRRVAVLVPDVKERRLRLRKASHEMPAWLEM
jgi:predicted metal-dependent hydrolase